MLVLLLEVVKTFRNIMLIFVCLVFVTIVALGVTYKINLNPVDKSDSTKIEVVIPENTSVKEIGEILKEKDLIKSSTFFNIYVKLFKVGNMKASTYYLSRDMDFETIIDTLVQGNSYNPNEITITFKEGINMRDIATVISKETNNSYESVIEKANDLEYIDKLINKYWFITNEIKNDNIYYKLEGYLFPETYSFKNKDVTVEEIFNKMIDQMGKKLEPLKEDINNSDLSVHEILTLASMVEKEAAGSYSDPLNQEKYYEERRNVASVFLNRIKLNMSLGSDVTTRYALKIDDPKKALTTAQFNTVNPYNTRQTDGSMNGKLPIGPISTVSIDCIKASVYPAKTNNIYFLANIQTRETLFFEDYQSFQKKKAELQSVNNGL